MPPMRTYMPTAHPPLKALNINAMTFPILTAQEAASHIKNGYNVGFSGFTVSGTPKVVSVAIADFAKKEHEAGREFKINVFTGASTNDFVDGELTRANAINKRTPYQSCPDFRKAANSHAAHYFDLHLSELAQKMRYNTFGKLDVAIIEVQSITDDGEAVLSTGLGNTPTFTMLAEKVIIELNDAINPKIRGLHDVYVPLDPPYRREIPIYKASDRAGAATLKIDPKKIIGVVKTSVPGGGKPFSPADETTLTIGDNVCHFLMSELKAGRIPSTFLPLQSGVGNIANAVLAGLDANPDIPAFDMYTEVIQDSVLELIKSGKCRFASTCSMTFSKDTMAEFFENIDKFHDKVMIRPAEISNNPEVIRRLGVITMNTALEADIFGNINSTHVVGTKMMNGIGGSGDFTRNAYTSIYSCPSVAKGGLISAIVPMASHVDHSEHSVDVLITEQGIADLRGKDPVQRAETIIENCAHPDYRPLLREYLKMGKGGQTPHTLRAAFAFHDTFITEGDMKKTDFAKYL